MSDVTREVPSGAINWVNKTFVLLNSPSSIDEVWMDGANYLDYVIAWNILTLTDAPTLSITVDYSYGVTSVPVNSVVTLWDIKSLIWTLLGQRSSSTTFSATVITQKANMVLREVCKGRYTAMSWSYRGRTFPWQTFRCGKMWFLEWSFPIRIMSGSSLSLDYNLWDTTITCDTTNILPSGWIEIGWESISYTSKSSTQLLWVSGWTISHLATESVTQLYQTPIGMAKPSSLDLIIQWIGSSNYTKTQTIDIPLDQEEELVTYYKIVRVGSLQLLKIVGLSNQSLVNVKYTKRVDDMVNDTDVCPLPEDYGLSVIAYLAAGELWQVKGMPNAQTQTVMGSSKLQVMYGDVGNVKTITKQKLIPKSYSNIGK